MRLKKLKKNISFESRKFDQPHVDGGTDLDWKNISDRQRGCRKYHKIQKAWSNYSVIEPKERKSGIMATEKSSKFYNRESPPLIRGLNNIVLLFIEFLSMNIFWIIQILKNVSGKIGLK